VHVVDLFRIACAEFLLVALPSNQVSNSAPQPLERPGGIVVCKVFGCPLRNETISFQNALRRAV
jgi:hypothetical protein